MLYKIKGKHKFHENILQLFCKWPVTWGQAVIFVSYSGFLRHLQLASLQCGKKVT